MVKNMYKLKELGTFSPIQNEEAFFLCGGTNCEGSDLSKTEGDSSQSTSADPDANTKDSDGGKTKDLSTCTWI